MVIIPSSLVSISVIGGLGRVGVNNCGSSNRHSRCKYFKMGRDDRGTGKFVTLKISHIRGCVLSWSFSPAELGWGKTVKRMPARAKAWALETEYMVNY